MHGGNPMDYLALTDPVDRMVANLILQRAEDVAEERRQAYFKAMMVAVQNGVVRAYGKG